MRFQTFVVGAALAALGLPAALADERKQVAPIAIDLQGQTADGQRLAGRAILTPLPDGRVQVDHPVRQADGRTRIQSGVGTLQGDTIRVDLQPVQGGLTHVLDDRGPQSGPLPVTIAVDPRSGAVQTRGPDFQTTAPRSSKVKQFFAGLKEKTKAGWSKTKGFFGRMWASIKSFFAKVRARFSRNRETTVIDAAPGLPGCPAQQGPPAIAPTPIVDLPSPAPIAPTPIIDLGPPVAPTPIEELDGATATPIFDGPVG